MWPAKQLDIGWSDLAAAAVGCLHSGPAPDAAHELEQDWAGDEALACLSVRTGFDLLLTALSLPPGSEILLSAVTIPDMVRIVQHHGLTPVPIDLELDTLAPRLDLLEAAFTPRTRLVVVAHLFGARVPMQPILEFARRRNLWVVEDLAQGFAGPADRGHPDSDVAMFSFGLIKTATALGGALLRVRDRELLAQMRQLAAEYPVQSRSSWLRRVLKYSAFKAGLTAPMYTPITWLLTTAGCDYDRAFASLVRGFPGTELFRRLRQRPCAPLLGLLARRLKHFDPARLARRGRRGRDLTTRLEGLVCVPGSAAAEHSHWVSPILVDDPPAFVAQLARGGFHATQGRSLCAVSPTEDLPQLRPLAAQRLLQQAVFLPIYSELPDGEFERLIEVVRTASSLAPSAKPATQPQFVPALKRRQPALSGGGREGRHNR